MRVRPGPQNSSGNMGWREEELLNQVTTIRAAIRSQARRLNAAGYDVGAMLEFLDLAFEAARHEMYSEPPRGGRPPALLRAGSGAGKA